MNTFEQQLPLNMKILLITILALISLQLKAQTWVQVPDANFQTYLTANYPAGAFSTSGGNFFVDSDFTDVQAEDTLDISSLNISSIEGIQAFSNLVFLSCDYNDLTSLPVNLPTSIVYLSCRENDLTQLPVLPPGLTTLSCNNNQLTSLPGIPTTLHTLFCPSNLLTSLPNLPGSLTLLICSDNQLAALPALPNQLTNLSCGQNNLTSLPVLPQSLQYLDCNNNQLTQLPAFPANLGELFCGYNQLTTIAALPLNMLMLDVQGNQLSEIPDLPSSLYYLNCDSNNISVLPDLPDQLNQLICSRNQLTEITELPESLTMFFCYNNDIMCFVEFPISIQNLNIDNNPFVCLPNYIPAMNQNLLNYPLCDSNNPYGCPGAKGIEGFVFHDVNNDCNNMGEGLTYVPMSVYDTAGILIVSSTSLANGNYYFAADSGAYELSIDTVNLTPALEVTCPLGNSSGVTVPMMDTVVSGGDFGLVCNGFDLGVQSVVPYGWVFPGQTHELSILAGDITAQYNMYCASGISGEVTIAVTGPGAVTFGGSPTNVSSNTAVYSIADFGAVNANAFAATIFTNTSATAGQEFCVTVSVATAASGELDAANNLYSYCYGVVNSYDPNTKQTYPEIVAPGYTDEFTYTIHFQNTGNAPAFNIRLADTLDSNLELSTFKVVNASDAFTTYLDPASRLLTVRFPNIMLPDSTTDAEGSIGFIQYRIKPVAGLTDGTVIKNTAYIYFDFNTPIVTNTSENLFSESAGIKEFAENTVQLYPNPSDNQVFVSSEYTIEQLLLYDLNGTSVKDVSPNAKQVSVDISSLKSGIYITMIRTNQSVLTKRLIVR